MRLYTFAATMPSAKAASKKGDGRTRAVGKNENINILQTALIDGTMLLRLALRQTTY
jgi:hypothetical protein